MGNPNPFYRFKQGWNAGFFPDNQIMTDLINEMVGQLTIDLPSIWPSKTIDALYFAIKQWVKVYEGHPYYGRFSFSIQKIPDTPNNEYNINVFNPDMEALNLSGAGFTVNGFYNPTTNLVVNSNVNAFTPGSFSGSFAEPLINEEIKVSEALEIVNINGSAIFPITYSFNPISNVAISGLARGDNWFINVNGVPDRQPVPNLPYENRRTFELPALNGDDTYIVSVMERIIQASLNDINSVATEYAKYTMPDGWTKSIANPGFTTYNRYQINFVNASRRKFILVGRYDGQWLWQRFVSDVYDNAPYNFLTAYSEVTALPYEPLQAGRWLYNDDTFDFEFIDFTSDCYVSPEFYPMPAKPGDQYQFNVVDGNLTGINSVNVGLFKENGEFIQKIGEATREQRCCCNQYVFTREYTAPELDFIAGAINSNIGPGGWQYYFFISNGTDVIQSVSEAMPSEPITTPSELDAYFSQFSGPFVFSVNITGDDWESASGTITITTLTMNCDEPVLYMNEQIANEFNPIIPSTLTGFTITSGGCDNIDSVQLYASSTIPAVKAGCYRMGLYNEPTTECDITFTYTLSGEALTDYLDAVNAQFSGISPYLVWIANGFGEFVYTIVSDSTTAADIVAWCNSNIPGMTATEGEGSLTWTWAINDLPCGDSYAMWNCTSSLGGDCLVQLWTTENEPCDCGTSYYLYSLSNIINIDPSDCFSTMLEFWSDNNTMAQGYEYFDNWKQKIRLGINGGGEKPIIEESLYRQSNGVHRRPQNKQDLSLDLHSDFLDLETQLALVDATRHAYLVWEGKPIFVKGDIDVATIQDFTTQSSFETLAQVKFQALLQGFQPRNSSCLNC